VCHGLPYPHSGGLVPIIVKLAPISCDSVVMTDKSARSAKQPIRAKRKNLHRRLEQRGYKPSHPVYETASTLIGEWTATVAELVETAEAISWERSGAA
jgi:hypothetical protein